MMPKTLMSVEEFAALPDDGMLHELNEGELITMPPPRLRHGTCQLAIGAALREFVTARDRGTVYVESGFRLTPHTIRGPDVSFVQKSQLQDPDQYFNGAPDLAIEIVSPGDDASDLREKVKQYLDAGALVVWVVYPRTEQVEIYTPGNTARILGIEDTLEAPELLPGFKLQVRAILQ